MATNNVKAAGLSADVTIAQQDFQDFQGIENGTDPDGDAPKALMVTNPPYGERISTANLLETYKMIGERLKHAFQGGVAWVLSYKEECFQQIGLKPSLKVPLYNGSLECEYRKYSIFGGKLREFREEGGIVKTEAEKRKMAEKRRSWQKHDYDKKREERANNEEADILSFRFKSLERERSFDRKKGFSRDGGSDRKKGFNRDGGFDRKKNFSRDGGFDRKKDFDRNRGFDNDSD